jgi:drug/metabolite transporter (DMT)-like permease
MVGVLVIAAGSRVENDNDVTLLGDLGAFAAAIAFVVYISAGQHLRGI